MEKPITSHSPSRPYLALQIGITGHRPDKLVNADHNLLAERIDHLLKVIKTAYEDFAQTKAAKDNFETAENLPPRLLSPLAEGADRIAAKAALTNGYELHCPLPFPEKDYLSTFVNGQPSIEEFDSLWAKSTRKLELDGTTKHKAEAYREVGNFVLRHCDILLAVWDGKLDNNSPGTAGMITAAKALAKPLLWINSAAPHEISLYIHDKCGHWQAIEPNKINIGILLKTTLLPKDGVLHSQPRKPHIGFFQRWHQHCAKRKECRNIYFSHKQAHRNPLSLVFRGLFSLLGKHEVKGVIGNSYQHDALVQWRIIRDSKLPDFRFTETTGKHFMHADSLATFYADQYRGTFVASFLLGSMAVLCAVLGVLLKNGEAEAAIFPGLELFIILSIAILIKAGKYNALHQRWLDFRLLAERLRQHIFLTPVGGISNWSLPVYHSNDDQSLQWIDWLLTRIIRSEGIPAVKFDADYRQAYLDFLIKMIKDQSNYHYNNAKRNGNIAHLLHIVNKTLLVLIVVACGFHLADHFNFILLCGKKIEDIPFYSTIISATFPALGAAVAGILSQGEFERISNRSKGMTAHLDKVIETLNNSQEASVFELTEQAQQAIDIMSQELFDWRVIFRAKPLEQHA